MTTKQELTQQIKEGITIDVKASYSDGTVFIGMVEFEHGIEDFMIGYIIYSSGINNYPKSFKRKVYHDEKGAYIKFEHYNYYLNEFIRTDLGK